MKIELLLICIINILESLACKNFERNPFFKNHHLAALVLARGGSKSIPLKNLVKVNEVSILKRTLDVIQSVSGFSSVWVSTENYLIYKEALSISDVNIHWRSEASATDTATSIFAVQEFIKLHPQVDSVALVQCTSPFIKSQYLEKAIGLFNDKPCPCVFSTTKSHKLRWILRGGYASPLNFDINNRPRRQDFTTELIENGMFYFSTRQYIEQGYFQSTSCKIVDVPQRDSLEIDSLWDLKLANKIAQD